MPRSGNHFSNLFSHHSSAASSSSRKSQPPQPSPPPPAEFFCPVSSLLMANPVVVPSGHSFDRPCIQACRDLNFIPPHLNLNFPPFSSLSASSSSSFPLIPNLNLYHAILEWCQRSGHPLPTPLTRQSARHFIKGLMSMPSPPLPPSIDPSPYSSVNPEKEQWILKNLNKPKYSSKESAMAVLYDTRLCSPRILAAIIPLLATPDDSTLQTIAAHVVYRFSHDPSNRTLILRSGAVPSLITVLSTGIRRASAAAAGTFYKLSVDEPNRLTIGALGAIPALLDKFCEHFLSHMGRMEAALALYHLSLCPANLEVLVENEGVGRLMEAAADETSPAEMRRHALILLHCLSGLERGREEVMDGSGGGIGMLLGMVRDEGGGLDLGSMAVMYRVCRGSMGSMGRFREAAGAAGVEEVLVEKMEEWGEIGKEMAGGLVRVMRGECGEGEKLKEILVEIEQGPMEEVGEEEEEEEGEEREGRKKIKKIKERFREIVRVKRGESSSTHELGESSEGQRLMGDVMRSERGVVVVVEEEGKGSVPKGKKKVSAD